MLWFDGETIVQVTLVSSSPDKMMHASEGRDKLIEEDIAVIPKNKAGEELVRADQVARC